MEGCFMAIESKPAVRPTAQKAANKKSPPHRPTSTIQRAPSGRPPSASGSLRKANRRKYLSPGMLKRLIAESPIPAATDHGPAELPFKIQND
jgi:hypothetical protein